MRINGKRPELLFLSRTSAPTKHTAQQSGHKTDRQTDGQKTDRQIDRPTNDRPDEQTDKQTDDGLAKLAYESHHSHVACGVPQ